MKKRLTVIQAILLMGLAFALAYNLTTFTEQAKYNDRLANITEKERQYTKMVEVEEYVSKSFVGGYEREKVLDGALKGYVEALGDKYSRYLTVDEYEQYKARLSGEFGGIGVSIVYDEQSGGLQILNVYEESPAVRSGIRPFDIIVEIDGVPTSQLGYEGAVTKMKAEAGTPVVLSLLREGSGELIKVTVVRELIKEQTVFTEMLTEDIARVRVSEFGPNTHKSFKQELEKLISGNIHRAVIDLRFNPGGELTSLLSMMDILLDDKIIFVQRGKDGNESSEKSGTDMLDIEIVVLVNEYSYSAAEYFAAVMQEYGRAYIVGQQTTGKGYAQRPIPLSDGSGLVLSVFEYYTPLGISLADAGVTPDFIIEITAEDIANFKNLTTLEDKQLMQAISLMQQ